jgi:8-oxo-dGTP pyrophosphatase MutT (NUDIX family)/phosphohistidine phosphatase SixA
VRHTAGVIRAAGGVVWRQGETSAEIAVVHRPRYDDWSLPKGKLHADEPQLVAAMREIREETGVVGSAGTSLGTTEYDAAGEPKTVRWWSVRSEGGDFTPGDEVDELRWLPPREALELVREHPPVVRWLELPRDAAVVLLVRHASAGDPSSWCGPDDERPLDERGVQQARLIASVLSSYRPVRIMAAPPRRCIDTIAGLGGQLEIDARFGEDGAGAEPHEDLLEVAVPGAAVVVCSQGGVIPRILHALLTDARPVRARKGSVWALTVHDGRLLQADEDVLA